MTNCADESDLSLKALQREIYRRTISQHIPAGHQRAVMFHQEFSQTFFLHEFHLSAVSNRHNLDKSHMNRLYPRQIRHCQKILLRFLKKTIDLQRNLRMTAHRPDSLQNTGEFIPPCHLTKSLPVQSIQADRNRVNPGGYQIIRHLL